MVSFVLSFFPRDVLDEILKLIESVSEDFPSYSSTAYSLLLSPTHRPNMTEILLKGCKIASQSSIHSMHVCGVSPMAIRKKKMSLQCSNKCMRFVMQISEFRIRNCEVVWK